MFLIISLFSGYVFEIYNDLPSGQVMSTLGLSIADFDFSDL